MCAWMCLLSYQSLFHLESTLSVLYARSVSIATWAFAIPFVGLQNLLKTKEFSQFTKAQDEAEHSIEMQLPFLHYLLRQKSKT